MKMRLPKWLNSMQAHMIGFAFAVILVLTALGYGIIAIAGPPQRSPMSVHDISRVVRGLQPALAGLDEQFDRSVQPSAPPAASGAERELSAILARDLGVPADAARIHLGTRSENFRDYIDGQLAIYREDGRASPIIYGTVTAAVRQSDGRWLVFSRQATDGFESFWQLMRASPWLGALLIIPFSMWFSTRIARPVRSFALAAGQVGDGRGEFMVPVAGPNEIQVAAKALNDMQARIRAFIQERTVLIGAIAHDLRTPLNSLRFRIARASDDVRVPAEDDFKQLDRLINSILDYVESDGRAISIDQIDLTSMLQSMIDDLADQGIEVDFEASPVNIDGDLLLLRRMFTNLIDNALKFGSRVSVSLSATANQALVTIADDGPGMPAVDLAQAFEPFFRGEPSRNRKTGGIGLGLSIARSVAEAHNGQLHLSNQASGGLMASISLPLRHNFSG